MNADRSALIVGAGIGGLAAAVALRKAGWDVRVLERAATPRELGFALALAANARAALRELGVADAVERGGAEVRNFEIRRYAGERLKRVTFRGDGRGMRSVVTLRPALHGVLLDAVPRESLLLEHEARDLTVASTGVTVTLADGRALHADVLIGADGVGSVVRRRLHPAEPLQRPSGYHGLRGVSHDAAAMLEDTDAVLYLGDGIEAGFARASATAVYWYMSLVDEYAREGASAADVVERCTRELDPRVTRIVRATHAEDLRLDRLYRREPIDGWGTGPATLLGDAAHPVLPHTAQGAALALEDAVAVALALGASGDAVSALRAYEQVRSRRTRRVVRAGPRIAALTTTRSRARIVARDTAIRLLPAILLGGALRLQGRDPHAALRQR